ncbi:peptidylprolyl isomerase [Prochlorococcus sp. MIT 1341]|uniref:peptidylprolyl isomerase n=1 Tax=Prochlorococcus sp. MIT 1341 TaxID=3096221 RepID=UPI002A75C0B4|nr:peptidylprolyl isomerase [Prochlorococcus sp. MIT 1341]
MTSLHSRVVSSGLFSIFFSMILQLLSGCSQPNQSSIQEICKSRNFSCINSRVNIQIVTSKGIIKVEIDGANAPVTAGNFLDLLTHEIYDKTVFHRVVKYPTEFVIQGGDPSSNDPNTPKSDYGKGNFIDQNTGEFRYIPLEFKLKSERYPRYGKPIKDTKDLQNLSLPHKKGSIAMARSQAHNSASAQFYIALRNLPELDGRYSVFGKVIEGMNVVNKINEGDIIETIRISPK